MWRSKWFNVQASEENLLCSFVNLCLETCSFTCLETCLLFLLFVLYIYNKITELIKFESFI